MGSFAGISIDAQNLKEAVSLAEQKKYAIEQQRLKMLSDSLIDYRSNLFPDGQYYVTSDFNAIQFIPKKVSYNNLGSNLTPKFKNFKKGELVNVSSIVNDIGGSPIKIIQTDLGFFYADQSSLSKTKPVNSAINEPLIETKKENGNKLTIMIIGAFILGYLLTND
jgi:hypothetical protein